MTDPGQHMAAARHAVDRLLADTRRAGIPDLVVARTVTDVLGPHVRDTATITALRRQLDDTRAQLTREQTARLSSDNAAAVLRAELDATGRPRVGLD